MYLLPNFLDSLFRSHVNGHLQDVSRSDQSTFERKYSRIWLKQTADPYRVKGMDRARALYAIQQGITKIISIIYGSNQFCVQFVGEKEQDDIGLENRLIALTLEPLKQRPKRYDFYDSIDVITGSAIHLAAHLREGTTGVGQFKQDAAQKELSLLYHLAADVIHDRIIGLQYPGFEGYLLKYRQYFLEEKLIKKWGQKQHSQIHLLIQALRAPKPIHIYKRNVQRAYFYMLYILTQKQTLAELRDLDLIQLTYNLFHILFAENHFAHTRELNYMSERLILAKQGLPTPGEKGKQKGGKKGMTEVAGNHNEETLLEYPPLTGEELGQVSLEPNTALDELRVSREQIEGILNQQKSESIGHEWAEEFLHDPKGWRKAIRKHGLGSQEAEWLNQLEEDQYTSLDGVDHQFRYQVYRTIPKWKPEMLTEYKQIKQEIQQQIILLRNQLAWANTRMTMNQYSLKSGSLDEDALYQAKHSAELFMNTMHVDTRTQRLDMILLIDGSSSMYEWIEGTNLTKHLAASQLAALFIEAMEPISSIQTWTYLYKQDSKTSIGLQELYSPQKGARKERISSLQPGLRTPEYQALLAISKWMNTEGRGGAKKVYLILSDGQPGDDYLPYPIQKAKIRALVNELQQQGHVVIQIALGSDSLSNEIYNHCVPFPREGYTALVKAFGKLLRSLL